MTDHQNQGGAALLEAVQRLQFSAKPEAERLLLGFIRETFPTLDVTEVLLRPQAVSLNSFNGFLTLANRQRLFFKTHVEQDNVISEYYSAQLLADAGYPVIQPLYSSTRAGQQLVIYAVVEQPSVFDVARSIEDDGDAANRSSGLRDAQHHADDQLFALYTQSLLPQPADEAARAGVHQLFYHRLVGGRLDRFYGSDTSMALPGQTLSAAAVRQARWTINGAFYNDTLDDIIQRAIKLLQPAQAGHSIVGHGDAHNGNVFYDAETRQLTYFDPAFAGRHSPLLDLTKPLFHNVFAMWMYFPQEERAKLDLARSIKGDRWTITHNYALNPLRQMFLYSKTERVLMPTLRLLQQHAALPVDWRAMLKAALFCCPFLTLDLKRFPPEISLLGLTMAVQMGAESTEIRSTIDRVLDQVEAAL
ncbi:MAG: hypothetical protein H7Y11_14065 [Armatimonadetes bacterium]|nr:hypothetical protein [Anaerolineae bacterium]